MNELFIQGAFIYVVFILSAVFHEFMHGWMANRLGDPTAKHLGRLTLNPIAHIDLYGTVIIPLSLVLFGSPYVVGWAKPVPYNPYNLSDQKYGSTKVALVGPAANFLIALIFGLLLRFDITPSSMVSIFFLITQVNVLLGVFNLIPFPPLDGSKLLMDLFPRAFYSLQRMGLIGIILAFFIAIKILPYITHPIVGLITGY